MCTNFQIVICHLWPGISADILSIFLQDSVVLISTVRQMKVTKKKIPQQNNEVVKTSKDWKLVQKNQCIRQTVSSQTKIMPSFLIHFNFLFEEQQNLVKFQLFLFILLANFYFI